MPPGSWWPSTGMPLILRDVDGVAGAVLRDVARLREVAVAAAQRADGGAQPRLRQVRERRQHAPVDLPGGMSCAAAGVDVDALVGQHALLEQRLRAAAGSGRSSGRRAARSRRSRGRSRWPRAASSRRGSASGRSGARRGRPAGSRSRGAAPRRPAAAPTRPMTAPPRTRAPAFARGARGPSCA